MKKSDTTLREDVELELRWDPRVGQVEVGVAARDGVVTLSGQVDSYARKTALMDAAQRVSGVTAIADDVVVVLPHAAVRTDTQIAHAVAEALRWDVEVPDDTLHARVDGGWVWLEGEVKWQYQRSAAERAVRFLTGVKGVSNKITIRKHAWAPEVKERIESALKRQADVDAQQIVVDAEDGAVTLKGRVHSWSARADAERAAWSAPGVVSVRDELAVTV